MKLEPGMKRSRHTVPHRTVKWGQSKRTASPEWWVATVAEVPRRCPRPGCEGLLIQWTETGVSCRPVGHALIVGEILTATMRRGGDFVTERPIERGKPWKGDGENG